MLVLSRKEGEKLVIGGNVVITVNRIAGNRVAIGIEAPREVSILRGELAPPLTKSMKLNESHPSAAAAMFERGVSVASQMDR